MSNTSDSNFGSLGGPAERRSPSQSALLEMMADLGERVTHMERNLPTLISGAVIQAIGGSPLSEEERRWVRLKIDAEKRSFEQAMEDKKTARKAVIERVVGGIVALMLVVLGAYGGQILRPFTTILSK